MTDAPTPTAPENPEPARHQVSEQVERGAIAILLANGFAPQRVVALRQQEPISRDARKILGRARRDAAAALASMKKPSKAVVDAVLAELEQNRPLLDAEMKGDLSPAQKAGTRADLVRRLVVAAAQGALGER